MIFKKPIIETKLVKIRHRDEKRIFGEIAKIDRIKDYLELTKQAGYELYGKTDDRRYLGYVNLAETFLTMIDDALAPPEEETKETKGYEPYV